MSSNPTPLITLDNVAIGYKNERNQKVVAKGIDAVLHSGQLTCLLGANGSGKSTLLRTLSNFQPILNGFILFNGKPYAKISRHEFSKLIGIVTTERIDSAHLTVRDVVSLGRSPYTNFFGKLSDEDERIVATSLKQINILALVDRRISTLSDGERQKVMIAKVLAQQTQVILLDEPTAFLDYPSKIDTLILLKQLAKSQGKAILVSTHDLELALQLSDQMWLIDNQNGFSTGQTDRLIESGVFETYFRHPNVAFNRASRNFKLKQC